METRIHFILSKDFTSKEDYNRTLKEVNIYTEEDVKLKYISPYKLGVKKEYFGFRIMLYWFHIVIHTKDYIDSVAELNDYAL